MRSWSSVVIGTMLWTGQSEIHILAGARDFSHFWVNQTSFGTHAVPFSTGTAVLSRGNTAGM